MPALIFSDPHFHNFKQFSTIEAGGFPSRLLLIEGAWKEAVDFGAEMGANCLLIPGDVNHVRAYTRPTVAKVIHRCLIYAMERGLDVVIVVGNHDMENYQYGISSLDVFDGLAHKVKRTTIIKSPVAVETKNGIVCGIPYCHNIGDFRAAYEDIIPKYNPRITLIHQGIDDFRPTKNLPETKLTAEYLSSINPNWVFAGHYHEAFVNYDHPKVISPGSLVQHGFGGQGNKYCYVLNDDDSIIHKKIESHPEFITKSVNSAGEIKKLDVQNKFVRWTVSKSALAEKVKEHCDNNGCAGFEIHIEKEFTTSHATTISLSSPDKMLEEYIDMHPKLLCKKSELLSLYHGICGGK